MRTLEDDFLDELSEPIRRGEIEVLLDNETLNQRFLAKFPFDGSRVDWRATRNQKTAYQPVAADVGPDFEHFFDACLAAHSDEAAYYANDGLEVTLRAKVSSLRQHLQTFVELPHVGYFLAADCSWCLALTMNGDMDFGEAPLKSSQTRR